VCAQGFHAVQQSVAALKLDGVTLPVVEAEHFDARKALQRPCEAGGGILSPGKQHQRGFGLELIAHGVPLALIDPQANWWKVRPVWLVSLGWTRVLRHTSLILFRLRCTMTPSRDISRLLEIMATLRTPGSGCPWDLEQNF